MAKEVLVNWNLIAGKILSPKDRIKRVRRHAAAWERCRRRTCPTEDPPREDKDVNWQCGDGLPGDSCLWKGARLHCPSRSSEFRPQGDTGSQPSRGTAAPRRADL